MDVLSLIEFEDPNKSNGVIKASIHKTGKLGFSSGAQDFLKINEKSLFKVGFNPENNSLMYLVPVNNPEQAFKVSKAGLYFYLNLKNVFDKKGIDYINENIIFDIKKEISNDSQEYFILTKRNR